MRFSASCWASIVLSVTPGATAYSRAGVNVVNLSVDGRTDSPLGLGNANPTLAWQMIQNENCDDEICPGDHQTAYRIEAAATIANLRAGKLLWDSGQVEGDEQQAPFGHDLSSRDTVAWRVRVWDAHKKPSSWSRPSTWTTGLLKQEDWGEARWIDYPGRNESQPLPLFARQFTIPRYKRIVDARLYLSGVGMHHATVNGKEITDEVLAPGYSNYQLSSEYRTYDIRSVLQSGSNTIGVSLGSGPAYIEQIVKNPAVGRDGPYAWWQSQLNGNGTLSAQASAGSTKVQLDDTEGYHLGGTINIGTDDGGAKLESRKITAVGNSSVSFTPGLKLAHETGTLVTGSGNNIAATDPSAGSAVTPRLIGRLEITYGDGSSTTIVTDRSWRTKLGPLVTTQWYSGSDYDARREQPGWDAPNAKLTSHAGWIKAGFAPPPNLATKLVARAAEPVMIQERFTPVSITNPAPGIWVFDLGQNIAGWPLLKLPKVPAGLTIRMSPAESLFANGTVDQASIHNSARGNDIFDTYTTAGKPEGETWHADFNYFGMQWVQVTGLPDGFKPTKDLITGLRLQADVPQAGTFRSSDDRINRIHKMARYSFASNMLSVFTDCPGREKLSYEADYVMPVGAISRNFGLGAYFRTIMHHLVEAQSIADTPMFGNVALKAPVYDWGYNDQFGDEINWGDAIVLVPSLMHDLVGDKTLMIEYYDQMTDFVDYIQREKVQDHIVNGPLADWVEDVAETSGRITGTWAYYHTINAMAQIANVTGREDDAKHYGDLAPKIRDAFNGAFFNDEEGRYTNTGNNGTSNATQTAQALALDAGLVLEKHREKVLNALVKLAEEYPSEEKKGPHMSGGTIGMGSIVRALTAGDRDDILWEAVQQNDRPSYGYFMESTDANPDGFTTVGEQWDRANSKNHMILAQIDEWFHAGIAGIRPLALSTLSTSWDDGLVFQPKLVGDLEHAEGTYQTRWGEARSAWKRTRGGRFELTVTVPANTKAEVRVPFEGKAAVKASKRAKRSGSRKGYAIFKVPSGQHTFSTST